MIDPDWLFLIVPLSMMAGFLIGAMMAMSRDDGLRRRNDPEEWY